MERQHELHGVRNNARRGRGEFVHHPRTPRAVFAFSQATGNDHLGATPVMYTLGEAARAVGKAKSTISRDVKSGKISAARNPDGSVSIDPAELHRVYPTTPATGSGNGQSNDSQPLDKSAATVWERQISPLRERLAHKDDVIEDLRRRLDAETTNTTSMP